MNASKALGRAAGPGVRPAKTVPRKETDTPPHEPPCDTLRPGNAAP